MSKFLKLFLALAAGVAFFDGFLCMAQAKSSIHQVLGMIDYLIAVVAIGFLYIKPADQPDPKKIEKVSS